LRNEVLEVTDNVKFKFEFNPHLYEMTMVKTFHVTPSLYLANLREVIKKLAIPIICKTVSDFSEIDSNYIINCSGLGSKDLCKDVNAVAVGGHSIILENEDCGKVDYLIAIHSLEKYGFPSLSGNIYFMPNRSGFIGASYLVGYEGCDETRDK